MSMNLLAVGSVAFDSVRTPFGQVERAVGGSATYFSLAASYFTDVAVVGVVGRDFTDDHFRVFHEKGIDTSQVSRQDGLTFFWRGEYGDNLNEAHTLATELNVFAGFRPAVATEYRAVPVLFLGNIDPDLQADVLDQVARPRLVGLDTMNYWIGSKPQALARVLARVDVLLVNDAEVRQLSGEANVFRAARKVAAMGPRTVVVKRGEYGVMVFDESGLFAAPAFPVEEPVDPTGAGDSFAGGFMGYLAGPAGHRPGAVRRAALYGTVMASFNVEAFSVERLRGLTFPQIEARFQQMLELTRVDVTG